MNKARGGQGQLKQDRKALVRKKRNRLGICRLRAYLTSLLLQTSRKVCEPFLIGCRRAARDQTWRVTCDSPCINLSKKRSTNFPRGLIHCMPLRAYGYKLVVLPPSEPHSTLKLHIEERQTEPNLKGIKYYFSPVVLALYGILFCLDIELCLVIALAFSFASPLQ